MYKKYFSPSSLASYFAFVWGLGLGLAQFSIEGWGMNDITNLFHTPLGWASVSLIALSIGIFVFRFFVKELSHSEFIEARDARLPELAYLKDELRRYFRSVYLLSRKKELYDIKPYQSELRKRVNTLKQLWYNAEFVKLKLEDDNISSLKNSIYVIANSLSNKRLKKLLDKAFEAEVKASSQQIAIRLYRTQFIHTNTNDNKLINSEDSQEPNFVKDFGRSLRDLYGHINTMVKGVDLDGVQILSIRKRD